MIKVTTNESIEQLALLTPNGAEMEARFVEEFGEFAVGLTGGSTENTPAREAGEEDRTFWYFDHDACLEAIEFFSALAEELARRRAACAVCPASVNVAKAA